MLDVRERPFFKCLSLTLVLLTLTAPCLALTDYQKGVQEGFDRGWSLAQRYDQAQSGDPVPYNQAVPKYKEWVASIFGQNTSVMPALEVMNAVAQGQKYTLESTFEYIPKGNAKDINSGPSQTTNDIF